MTEPDATMDNPCSTEPAALESVAPLDSAATLASILDRYMADLRAGIAPDRTRLIDAHPEMAAQLDACLAGIEFIHNATRSAPEHRLNSASSGSFVKSAAGAWALSMRPSKHRYGDMSRSKCYGSAWWPTKTR